MTEKKVQRLSPRLFWGSNMNSNYYYLDDENLYTYPNTSILRNKLDVQNLEKLHLAEHLFVSNRLVQLVEEPIPVMDIKSVRTIHEYLFQDVYTWAGEYRRVNISKEGKPFMPFQSFHMAEIHISSLISQFKRNNDDITTVSRGLAEILDNLNYMHPFREGNGRAQREVIRCLALSKNYTLELNPINNSRVYNAYMQGAVESNVVLLTEIIVEQLT